MHPAGHVDTLGEILASTCPVRLLDAPTGQRRPPATQPAASALVECLAVVDPLARLIPRPSSWCSPVVLDLGTSARHVGELGECLACP
jgi:hypothetical protein